MVRLSKLLLASLGLIVVRSIYIGQLVRGYATPLTGVHAKALRGRAPVRYPAIVVLQIHPYK